MSEQGSVLLMITADIDPSFDIDFNKWYDKVHLPEIVACPGFLSGRRAVALDSTQSPRYITLYEVEHTQVLDTQEVAKIRGWGPFTDAVSNYRRLWFQRCGPIITHDAVSQSRNQGEGR